MNTDKDGAENNAGKSNAEDAESDLPLGRKRPKKGLTQIPPTSDKKYGNPLSPHERFTDDINHDSD